MSNGNGLSDGEIAAIVGGSVGGLLVLGGVFFLLYLFRDKDYRIKVNLLYEDVDTGGFQPVPGGATVRILDYDGASTPFQMGEPTLVLAGGVIDTTVNDDGTREIRPDIMFEVTAPPPPAAPANINWPAPVIANRQNRRDPMVGGISTVGVASAFGAGTLGGGVSARNNANPMIISNWHILSGTLPAPPAPAVPVGVPAHNVLQPGLGDGGTVANDLIGQLANHRLGNYGGNGMDAAVASLNSNRPAAGGGNAITVLPNQLVDDEPLPGAPNGPPAGVRGWELIDDDLIRGFIPNAELGPAILGLEVWKSGRTTGVTRGQITSLGFAVVHPSLGPPPLNNLVVAQVRPDSPAPYVIAAPGDSGSMVLEVGTNRAFGLQFAITNPQTTIQCRLAAALDLFSANLNIQHVEEDYQFRQFYRSSFFGINQTWNSRNDVPEVLRSETFFPSYSSQQLERSIAIPLTGLVIHARFIYFDGTLSRFLPVPAGLQVVIRDLRAANNLGTATTNANGEIHAVFAAPAVNPQLAFRIIRDPSNRFPDDPSLRKLDRLGFFAGGAAVGRYESENGAFLRYDPGGAVELETNVPITEDADHNKKLVGTVDLPLVFPVAHVIGPATARQGENTTYRAYNGGAGTTWRIRNLTQGVNRPNPPNGPTLTYQPDATDQVGERIQITSTTPPGTAHFIDIIVTGVIGPIEGPAIARRNQQTLYQVGGGNANTTWGIRNLTKGANRPNPPDGANLNYQPDAVDDVEDRIRLTSPRGSNNFIEITVIEEVDLITGSATARRNQQTQYQAQGGDANTTWGIRNLTKGANRPNPPNGATLNYQPDAADDVGDQIRFTSPRGSNNFIEITVIEEVDLITGSATARRNQQTQYQASGGNGNTTWGIRNLTKGANRPNPPNGATLNYQPDAADDVGDQIRLTSPRGSNNFIEITVIEEVDLITGPATARRNQQTQYQASGGNGNTTWGIRNLTKGANRPNPPNGATLNYQPDAADAAGDRIRLTSPRGSNNSIEITVIDVAALINGPATARRNQQTQYQAQGGDANTTWGIRNLTKGADRPNPPNGTTLNYQPDGTDDVGDRIRLTSPRGSNNFIEIAVRSPFVQILQNVLSAPFARSFHPERASDTGNVQLFAEMPTSGSPVTWEQSPPNPAPNSGQVVFETPPTGGITTMKARFPGRTRIRAVVADPGLGNLTASYVTISVPQFVRVVFLPEFDNDLEAFGLRRLPAVPVALTDEQKQVNERVKQAVIDQALNVARWHYDRAGANVRFTTRDLSDLDPMPFVLVEVGGERPAAGHPAVPANREEGAEMQLTRSNNLGIFPGEFLNFSNQPDRAGQAAPAAKDAQFDNIFDPLRPGAGGNPVGNVTGGTIDYPTAPPAAGAAQRARYDQIIRAIRVLGNLIGEAIAHNVGHTLGLGHSAAAADLQLMDDEGDRGFVERSLSGSGLGAEFTPAEVNQLHETVGQVQPFITNIVPNNGPIAGGTNITINGRGFTATADTHLTIMGIPVPAASLNVVNEGQITCDTPGRVAGWAGPTRVFIANSEGTFLLPRGFRYT